MASLLKKIRRLWRPKATPAVQPQPVIQPQSFARTQPRLHAARKSSSTEGTGLVSQLCRHATLDSATFRGWAEQLREPWRAHRKLWELAFICQALDERGMLALRDALNDALTDIATLRQQRTAAAPAVATAEG